jgi:hypothetical protein
MLREREPAKAAPEAYAALRWATPAEVINLALTRSDQKLWQLYQETVAVKRDRDPISVST